MTISKTNATNTDLEVGRLTRGSVQKYRDTSNAFSSSRHYENKIASPVFSTSSPNGEVKLTKFVDLERGENSNNGSKRSRNGLVKKVFRFKNCIDTTGSLGVFDDYANGTKYEGFFNVINRCVFGMAKVTWRESVYDGYFHNGRLIQGTITINHPETKKILTVKHVDNGELTKCIDCLDEITYEGKFNDSDELIRGTKKTADCTARGRFENKKLTGGGKVETKEGHIYRGIWEEDRFFCGKITHANGNSIEWDDKGYIKIQNKG